MIENFSFNSTMILLAVLAPIPGIDVKDLTSELIIFCLNSLGFVPDKIFHKIRSKIKGPRKGNPLEVQSGV